MLHQSAAVFWWRTPYTRCIVAHFKRTKHSQDEIPITHERMLKLIFQPLANTYQVETPANQDMTL